MKPTQRRGLLIVNGVLLAALAAVTLAPTSHGQGATQRARGEYTMLSGRIIGGNSHAVFVLDAGNLEMIAVRWNETIKGLDPIGYRNLQADAQVQPSR